MQVELAEIPSRVRLNSQLQLDVLVSNEAQVANAIGADELEFDLRLDVIGRPSSTHTGSADAASPAEVAQFTLPTDFASLFAFGITGSTDSQGAMNGEFFEPGSYTVVNPSIGSLALDDTTTSQTIDLGIFSISEPLQAFSFSVYNRAATGGAALDLESVAWSNESAEFSSNLEPFRDLAPGSNQDFMVEIDPLAVGEFANTLSLSIADEADLFGGLESTITIDFIGRAALAGDANLDDQVGFDDFLILSANFGQFDTDWTSGNFNGDNTSNFADFLLLSTNFGTQATVASVPEPSTETQAIALFGMLAAIRRRRR